MAVITGNNANNVLFGTSGADVIKGLGGRDRIYGGAGNDWISGGSGQDYHDGGTGIDTIDYTHFNGGGTYNLSRGTVNASYLEQIRNFENINTGNGNDRIIGTSGANRIFANGGNDNVTAGGGNDVIYGGAGNDILKGEAGRDRIYGGAGNDWISGGSGQDYHDGGTGIDTIDYTHFDGGGTYNLAQGTVNASYLEQIRNFENVNTGNGNDRIIGTSGANRIFANGGNDNVTAGGGNDVIYGGAGNDKLVGGAGNDKLVGGTGNDRLNGTSYASQGRGERDTLTSGSMSDRDVFVLGERNRVFYNDFGNSDYAVITDFDRYDFVGDVADKIQLMGSSSSYSISNVSVNGVSGAGIRFFGDLIAVVQGVNASSLNLNNSQQFVYG